MDKLIEYHFPLIGKQSVRLYEESKELYYALMQANEVDRLKNLDHLGAIRLAWSGARHSRWEYVMLTMKLCEQISKSQGLGLRSKVNVFNQKFSSGSELVKCWAMLLNIGHLDWTFATERALLLEVCADNNVREEVLSRIQSLNIDERLFRWASDILEKTKVYQFHHLIAFLRLISIFREDNSKQKWAEVLAGYILHNREQEDKSRSKLYKTAIYLRRIRRIAYLILDSIYTYVPLEVSLNKLLNNCDALIQLLNPLNIEEPISLIRDPLFPLEEYMQRQVYLHEEVIHAITEREGSLKKEIQDSIKKTGIDKTIKRLASGDIQRACQKKSLEMLLRLEVWGNPWLKYKLLPEFELGDKIKQVVDFVEHRKAERIVPSVWSAAMHDGYVLQIHAESNSLQDTEWDAAIALAVVEVRKLRRTLESQKYIQELSEEAMHSELLEEVGSQLLIGILQLLGKRYANDADKKLEWQFQRIDNLPNVLVGCKRNISELLDKWIEEKRTEIDKGEFDELQGIKKWLDKLEEDLFLIIAVGRLVAYKDRKVEGELDSFVVTMSSNEKNIQLVFMEIKGGRKARKIKEQLQKTLEKLGLNVSCDEIDVENKVAKFVKGLQVS